MKDYLIRRFLLVIPSLFGITLVTFGMLQLTPGNPITLRLEKLAGTMGANSVPAEVIAQTKKLYGLDQPVWKQYVSWVWRICRLDFGTSFKDRRPVLDKILETLPITIQLNVISIFLIYVLAVPLGVYSATHHLTWQDSVLTVILFLLYSLPEFWVAMLLLYFFAGGQFVHWFPVYGMSSTGAAAWPWYQWLFDRLWHIALPVACLTYGGFAGISRFMRAGMIDVIRQDYIRTARAYGFSEKIVVYKYAMRNSLIPILTLLGTLLPGLLAGSVIIENIFSIPGLGRLSYDAILSRDYPLIMGILTFDGVLTLLGLIVSDIMYAIADPRIKFE